MGFGIKAADVTAIKAKTDNLPSDPAGQSATNTQISGTNTLVNQVKTQTDLLPSDPADESLLEAAIAPKASQTEAAKSRAFFMDFWGDPIDIITVPAVAADLSFPDVVVAALPTDLSIIRVVAMLKVRSIKDTSAADNKINAASKTLRVKKSTGAWGTDDIVAINFTNGQWYTVASTKEGGDVMVGDNDLSSEVDGNATYNFRSEQTNRADAIVALAASLVLYDVQTGIRVYLKTP